VAREITWHGEGVERGPTQWSADEFVCTLAPGRWRLDVVVPGYVVESRDVDVVAGERTDVGEIALTPEVPLIGRIVDSTGRGVPGAMVFVDDPSRKANDRLLYTGADGRFTVHRLGPGEYRVRVSREFADIDEVEATHALARDSAPLLVTAPQGAMLRVRLHGADLRDIGVRAARGVAGGWADQREEIGWGGPGGPGSFSRRLPAGAWRVVVQRGDDDVATRDVELREGEDVTIDIDLPK
jgi:hypothetical protein